MRPRTERCLSKSERDWLDGCQPALKVAKPLECPWTEGKKDKENSILATGEGRGEQRSPSNYRISPQTKALGRAWSRESYNKRIPAKSFTSVNLWNTDRRAADNSQGSLKQEVLCERLLTDLSSWETPWKSEVHCRCLLYCLSSPYRSRCATSNSTLCALSSLCFLFRLPLSKVY